MNMAEHRTLRRFVALIDGCEPRDTERQTNRPNIERMHRLVHDGLSTKQNGQQIVQRKRYYPTVNRLAYKSMSFGDPVVELVKDICRDICDVLETPQDELYLLGSGNGAFIARAVAGMMHHMGLPRRDSITKFDEIFEGARDIIKARIEDDHRMGPKRVQTLKGYTMEPPKIPFVGLFDTLRVTTKYLDVSFNPSVRMVRHAVALNETRRAPLGFDEMSSVDGRSIIEAWFMGTNDDLCGGVKHDGLSQYPLQWMLLEAIQADLALSPVETQGTKDENPLTLVFPQFAGSIPPRQRSEEAEWKIKYSNGIEISLFDLSVIHNSGKKPSGEDHAIKLDPGRYSRHLGRPVFEPRGAKLLGYKPDSADGTILHPSLLCILDTHPRYMELGSFRSIHKNIADFQETCVDLGEATLPPWMENMELQASGVKAFRILVCGKTGVGKSTLINKVFGVEMTEESSSYDQGVHDINQAFESPRHPGLLVHDSRGWQAGSDAELNLIAQFLRHRAFQNDPAEALHVIWFCVDSDVSRIEEADKRTFQTISQFSNQVPVFVVGTKKDKVISSRQLQLLEKYMEETNDYKRARELAQKEAADAAEEQFSKLRAQLSQIEHYRADGYCCISKDDNAGVKDLLSQTLELIVDERVRIFCVAAQVVDVEQKINAAITESMRLGTHAVRTAAVPLPFTGLVGTPTVSRLIVEHVLQCFGFPKTTPAEVEDVMKRIVSRNRGDYLKVGLTQSLATSVVTLAIAIPTAGFGAVAGIAGCFLSVPPAARMLLKCSCDMILILERAFRYDGKYVSVKQIEDAAKYYTTTKVKTFSGNEKHLQQLVHDEVDRLVPLTKVMVGINFKKLRNGVEDIIYGCRFDQITPANDTAASISSPRPPPNIPAVELTGSMPAVSELDGGDPPPSELAGSTPSRDFHGSQRSWPRDSTNLSPTVTSPSISGATVSPDTERKYIGKVEDKGYYTPPPQRLVPIMAELDASSITTSIPGTPNQIAELEAPSTLSLTDHSKSEGGKSSRWKPSSWKLGKKTKSTSNR